MERDEIRRRMRANRNQISPDILADNSALIADNLFRLAEFMAAKTVMFYASFKSEVQTMNAIARALRQGTRVALPLSLPEEKQLRPYLISNPARDLRPGYCGIPEPDPAWARLLEPTEIDLVIIPGCVFDLDGGRLGYGGGFYDRFLADQAPAAFRVALAFEMQVAAGTSLPMAPHDQPMDCLVTEQQTYRFSRGRC